MCWSLLHNHLERGLCSPSSCIHAQAPSHSALRPLMSLPFSASSPLTELHVSQPPQGLTWEFATSQACSSFAPNLTAFSFCSPLPPCPRSPHTSGEFQGVDSSFPPVSGPFWTLLISEQLRSHGRPLTVLAVPSAFVHLSLPHLQYPDHRVVQPPPLLSGLSPQGAGQGPHDRDGKHSHTHTPAPAVRVVQAVCRAPSRPLGPCVCRAPLPSLSRWLHFLFQKWRLVGSLREGTTQDGHGYTS